jgi:hypothetical protein
MYKQHTITAEPQSLYSQVQVEEAFGSGIAKLIYTRDDELLHYLVSDYIRSYFPSRIVARRPCYFSTAWWA